MEEMIITQLIEANVGKIMKNEPLSKHTTMRIGGPADVFISPKDISSLIKAMRIIRKNHVPWIAIGRGSNLIIADEGIRGIVIKVDEGLDHLQINGTKIIVGAGYSIVKLATQMSRLGLNGLAFASGIPGNIGGALYMNAGAHGSDMAQIVTKIHVLLEDGTTTWMDKEQLQYAYRTSWLQKNKAIVLEAELQLEVADPKMVTEIMQYNKEYRKNTQPWNFPCAGSIFRNPLPNYAGKLIEDAGLKGYQIGGAQISSLHGNFIVNAGEATANDVFNLIAYVQKKIKEKYGIELETEVKFLSSSIESVSN